MSGKFDPMFTISIVPKRGLFPYAIHMRDGSAAIRAARQLAKHGFAVHSAPNSGDVRNPKPKRFNAANIRSVTVTGPGIDTPVNCK